MSSLDDFLAQLDAYRAQAQSQQETDADQASYWNGVRFGLELALMEARNWLTPPGASTDPPAEFYAEVDRLVFNYFERVMALCQAPIKRDLLLFNLETIRTELQQAIRKQANPPGRKAKP